MFLGGRVLVASKRIKWKPKMNICRTKPSSSWGQSSWMSTLRLGALSGMFPNCQNRMKKCPFFGNKTLYCSIDCRHSGWQWSTLCPFDAYSACEDTQHARNANNHFHLEHSIDEQIESCRSQTAFCYHFGPVGYHQADWGFINMVFSLSRFVWLWPFSISIND